MDINLLINNLTNPALLFFVLGVLAVQFKSDLTIPAPSSKFISLYLLFSIGFKGGQELTHSHLGSDVIGMVLFGILSALVIPIYTFFLLKKKFGIQNAGAIASAYGSVSAVTFVTTVAFLEIQKTSFGGYMVATMALMEAPAIVVGVLLMSYFDKESKQKVSITKLVHHSLTNGSVFLIVGSLIIGFLASEKQAEGIAPFTTDIFKGFLAVFLLDMGIESGKKLSAFWKHGFTPFLFATIVPAFNGVLVALLSGMISDSIGDRLLLSVLASSASYIAVPAAMKIAAPKANSGIYLPMALAVTFPFNITLGIPMYFCVIQFC